MTDQEIYLRYSVSCFDRWGVVEPLPADLKAKARAEFDADPIGCLRENITEAQRYLKIATKQFHEARLDGLFDADRARVAGDKERWLHCIDTVRGDYQRARSDLAHWTAAVANYRGTGAPRSLRELAENKS